MNPPVGSRPPEELDDLRARLEQSRARLQRGRYLRSTRTALWVTVIAALIATGARIAAFFTDLPPLPAGAPLAVALVVLAAASAAMSTRVRLTRPSLLTIARYAEERADLDERLSTALEVAAARPLGGPRSTIGEALLLQAAASASRVDPRRLVERRHAREALSLALPLALALLTLALPLPLPTRGPTSPVVESGAATSARARDEATTDLRRAAELVAREAEERNDAYLQALARNLNTLEEQVAAAAVTPSEARAELDRLLDDFAGAYGLERMPRGVAPGTAAEPASRGVGVPEEAAPSTAGALAGREEAPKASAAAEPFPEEATAREAFAELLGQLDDRVQATQDAFPPAPRDPSAPSPLEGVSRADITGYIFQEDVEQYERQRRFQERLQPQMGASIGAAQQSSRGDSRRAGEGSQSLAGDEPASALAQPQFGDGLALPDAARSSGRRITLQLPPETRHGSVEAAPAGGEAWRRGEEAPSERHVVGMIDLAAVSRYFMPTEDAPAEAEAPR